MKNLLIEGMPGCGKSTVILRSLKEAGLLPCCVGYRTVRVFSTEKQLRGFAQVPAKEEHAAAEKSGLHADAGGPSKLTKPCFPEVECVTDASIRNLFLDFSRIPPLQEDVFRNFTVKSLCPGPDTKIILIDEMGGRELELPEVRDVFFAALTGPLPVIGVLKCPEHARHFSFPAYESFCRQIREETDTELYAMTADTRAEALEHVRSWLSEKV